MALARGPQTEPIRLKQKHNKMKQTNKSHLAVLLRECENHLLKKKPVHSRHSYRSPPLLFLPPSIPLFSPLSMSPSFVDNSPMLHSDGSLTWLSPWPTEEGDLGVECPPFGAYWLESRETCPRLQRDKHGGAPAPACKQHSLHLTVHPLSSWLHSGASIWKLLWSTLLQSRMPQMLLCHSILAILPGPAQKLLPGEPSLISPFLDQNSLFLLCIPATLVPPPPLTRLWCLYNTIMQAFLTFSLIRALLHFPEPILLLVFCLNTHKCSRFNLKAGCVPASTIC